jgi:shikimate dehydrogenase
MTRRITEDITKDTVLCMSLAARPSNIGTRFHNYLYDELGLDYVYKAFTTTDLPAAAGGIRALGIRGCGVSMPFKEACVELVDELDESARAIGSVNTIVNTGGFLRAYNTDYLAIRTLLAHHEVPATDSFAVKGSGGMAKTVVAALRDAGFGSGVVVARNEQTGRSLAGQYGYAWRAQLDDDRPSLLVNATPLGMAGAATADDLSFTAKEVAAARTVFDVVALPAETPLVRLARSLGKRVISGAEVIKLQAVEQFVLYTGIRPTDEQAQRASEFSRASHDHGRSSQP